MVVGDGEESIFCCLLLNLVNLVASIYGGSPSPLSRSDMSVHNLLLLHFQLFVLLLVLALHLEPDVICHGNAYITHLGKSCRCCLLQGGNYLKCISALELRLLIRCHIALIVASNIR